MLLTYHFFAILVSKQLFYNLLNNTDMSISEYDAYSWKEIMFPGDSSQTKSDGMKNTYPFDLMHNFSKAKFKP